MAWRAIYAQSRVPSMETPLNHPALWILPSMETPLNHPALWNAAPKNEKRPAAHRTAGLD